MSCPFLVELHPIAAATLHDTMIMSGYGERYAAFLVHGPYFPSF